MSPTAEQRGLCLIGRYLDAIADKPARDVLYRGHASADWALMPSVFRDRAVGIDNQKKLERWMHVAARFASPAPRCPLEWLVLAQHFGIPTPLLDWTANPLVGLFFAATGEMKAAGCVWQVRTTSAFDHFAHPETVAAFKKDRARPGLIFANAMNARSLAQDSAMSIHSGPHDIIPSALMRVCYRVEPSDKFPILSGLGHLGFTEERLFSDLRVVAQRFLTDLMLD